jgi:hypothetical protein
MGQPELERIKQGGDYVLHVEDNFDSPALSGDLWLAYYLPQWSSHHRSAARYHVSEGQLHLRIEPDQPPWCPEFDGTTRVSSVQTGVFAGPLGSSIGQHRFSDRLVVREEQTPLALYTPLYGLFEIRARAIVPPDAMVAFWMIGFEDEPQHSAEICVCEIFGHHIQSGRVGVGMGIHPWGDPAIQEEFSVEWLPIDVSEFHLYSVEWTAQQVRFFLDEKLVKVVQQSPSYPMQFLLNIYQFPPDAASLLPTSPNEFAIDFFRGYRRP